MEDYKKKYEDALKKAKENKPLEEIFPELKESEDERMRKDIISFVEQAIDAGYGIIDKERKDKWIAWLEKQCEHSNIDGIFVNVDEVREDFIQEVYRVLDADPTNDRANQIIDAFDNLPTVAIEKQGEKTNPYSGISFEYNGHIWGMCARDNGVDILLDKQLFKHLEKQGGQEPIIVPKFRVGDTIHKIGENTTYPRTIEKIENGDYVCDNGKCFVNIKFQDDYELVEQKLVESEPFEIEHGKYYYCIHDYYSGGNKRASKGDVVQALRGMSMMALGDRAGEYFLPVNHIEQKTVEWSENDKDIIWLIKDIIRNTNEIDATIYTDELKGKLYSWLNNLKPQSEQNWSEEDENTRNKIIGSLDALKFYVEGNKNFDTERIESNLKELDNEVEWLQNIKPQSHWKPSEEQVEYLRQAIKLFAGYCPTCLADLYDDLKKL